MSTSSSAHQPKFIFQIDPLLNMYPLIDLYPNCLTHVVDTDGLFHLQDHKSPIVLSYKHRIQNSSFSYQESFAAVRSPRCLLTIAAYFMLWDYNLVTLLKYVIPSSFYSYMVHNHPMRACARIFPQSFIIITDQSSISFDDNIRDIKRTSSPTDDLSSIFILHLSQDSKISPRILIGAAIQKVFGGLSFNCSTFESSSREIKRVMAANAKFVQDSWEYSSFRLNSTGRDPFQRGAQVGIEEGTAGFILNKPNHSMGRMSPIVSKYRLSFPHAPTELIPASESAAVKLVTTAGVFTPKSSHLVYFTPFLPAVWLAVLTSAGITLAMMIRILHIAQDEIEFRLSGLAVELATWILAVAIGQYKHSGIPIISGRSCSKNAKWVIVPVVVAWFILSTFLFNIYSAIFNSDATRRFHYLTNCTDFLQLPLDTWIYVLVNESSFRKFPKKYPEDSGDCTASSFEHILDFCYFHNDAVAACTTHDAIWKEYFKLSSAAERYRKMMTDRSWKELEQQRLDAVALKMKSLLGTLTFLCASTDSLSRVLLQSDKPMAFLISDHDFQKYWKLFVQVMDKYPGVKVANNFYSDDSFLVEPITFQLTSGLYPAYQGSVFRRTKVLLSSGIYGLWQKWHRIKFTDGGLQHAEKKLFQENKMDTLSFDNSGTLWVFLAQALAWLGAMGIFSVELILGTFSSWQRKLPCRIMQ